MEGARRIARACSSFDAAVHRVPPCPVLFSWRPVLTFVSCCSKGFYECRRHRRKTRSFVDAPRPVPVRRRLISFQALDAIDQGNRRPVLRYRLGGGFQRTERIVPPPFARAPSDNCPAATIAAR